MRNILPGNWRRHLDRLENLSGSGADSNHCFRRQNGSDVVPQVSLEAEVHSFQTLQKDRQLCDTPHVSGWLHGGRGDCTSGFPPRTAADLVSAIKSRNEELEALALAKVIAKSRVLAKSERLLEFELGVLLSDEPGVQHLLGEAHTLELMRSRRRRGDSSCRLGS